MTPCRPLRALLLLVVSFCCTSCIAWRFIGHGTEGIDDYETFPTDTVRRGTDRSFRFVEGHLPMLDTLRLPMRAASR